MITNDKEKTLRQKHNQELLSRMQNGEDLRKFNPEASWYPPRPIVKKDKSALTRLFPAQK
ncbi:MAG: hypothetical protein KBD78_00210 [Oligoflexales bacterium]|nr:hypothetical protein [Oligoflexales bacterium]